MDYTFFAPERIRFGWGARREAGEIARTLGRRAFVVIGSRTLSKNGRVDEFQATLREAGVEFHQLATISNEPEVVDVDVAAGKLRELATGSGNLVIAIGGGS